MGWRRATPSRGVTIPATSSQVTRARVHVSAPGCVIVSVNGKKHSQSSSGICPWTSFNKTIYYSSLDVLELFNSEGDANVIGFMLGHGMYTRQAGGTPMMRVKLYLIFRMNLLVDTLASVDTIKFCVWMRGNMSACGMEWKGLTLPMIHLQEQR